MFAQKNRIRKKREFEKIFSEGRKSKNRYFCVIWLENDCDCFRAAVVVSKKVDKSSVVRNKIKRRVKNVLLKEGIKKNIDLVVVAFPSARELGFSEIKTNIKKLLSKIK